MKLRDTKLLLLILISLGILLSGTTASAAVNLKIITDADVAGSPFLNNVTGSFFGPEDPPGSMMFPITSVADFLASGDNTNPTEPGDIFWGNGDFTPIVPPASITNSIGSSSISWGFNLDNQSQEQFFFQSFNTGSNEYANSLIFGENPLTFTRGGEITNIAGQPPLNVDLQTGTGSTVFNNNNTASFNNFTGSNGESEFTTLPIAGFWVTREDFNLDASLLSIFTADLFSDPGLTPLLSRTGVINHFIDIINIILPNADGDEWTLLFYDLSQFSASDTDTGTTGDFTGISFGTTFVSYDPGAIPTPIPAAVWLFGTGFLSMIAFARRRAKAQ